MRRLISYLTYGIFLSLVCLINKVLCVGQLSATREMHVASLDDTSKSLYTIYFSLDNKVLQSYYLRIGFPTTNNLSFDSCWMLLPSASDWVQTTCNKNVAEPSVLYIQFPYDVQANLEIVAQIQVSTSNHIPYATSAYALSTVNTYNLLDQFIIDINNNFAQIPYNSDTPASLTATLVITSPATGQTIPSQLVTIQVKLSAITSNVGSSLSPFSRIKAVTSLSNLSQSIPSILSYSRESPNQINVILSEYLVSSSSRAFTLQVTNVLNSNQPYKSTNLWIYVMDINSNMPYQQTQIPGISTSFIPMTAGIQLPSGDPQSNMFSFTGTSGQGVINNIQQHIQISVTPSSSISAGSCIKVTFLDSLVMITPGSAYISSGVSFFDPTLPVTYTYQQNNIMVISNLSAITAPFTITFNILSTTANTILVAYVSVDSSASTPYTSALYLSNSMTVNVLSSSSAYLELQSSNRIIPQSTSLTIVFNGSSGGIATAINSELVISFRNLIDKASGMSVTCSNSLICAYTSISTTMKQISITSPVGTNFFANGVTQTFTISGLTMPFLSNNENNKFQIYGCLKSTTASTVCLFSILSATITTQSDTLLRYSIANNSYSSTLNYFFSSAISMHFTVPTLLDAIIITSNQQRIITVFAKQGLRRATQLPSSQQSYSCASTIEKNCIFYQGNSSTQSESFDILNWDRVVFFLNSCIFTTTIHFLNLFFRLAALGSVFRVAIPDIFTNDNTVTYEYVWAIGYYDTTTRSFTYTSASGTNFLQSVGGPSASTATVYTRKARSSTSLKSSIGLVLSGSPGEEVDGIQMSLMTTISHIGRTAATNGYGGAVLINSEWLFWLQFTSKYTYTGYSTVPYPFGKDADSPLTMKYTDPDSIDHYLTILPLTNTVTLMDLVQTYYLDNVLMPYNYDTQSLVITISDYSGIVDAYNEVYNQGVDQFKTGSTIDLGLSCDNLISGVKNTYCQVSFSPSSRIQLGSYIILQFTNIYVSTTSCILQYLDGLYWTTVSQYSCSSNVNSSQLIIQLKVNSILENLIPYRIQFYGVDIAAVDGRLMNLQILDKQLKYIIEEDTISITAATANFDTISITQIQYDCLKPYVFTNLSIKFETPRELYSNEDIYIDLGKDLQDVNNNATSFDLILQRQSDQYTFNVAMRSTSDSKIKLLFYDAERIVADAYVLNFTSIRTPASNMNGAFQIEFVRNTDSEITLFNSKDQTVNFPQIESFQSSSISLSSTNFLLEGDLMQLNFDIKTVSISYNSSSLIFFYFPNYFSPGGSDFDQDIECSINDIPANCFRVANYPYLIKLTDPPEFINPGIGFKVNLFGLKVPNPSNIIDSQTLFVGIDGDGDNSIDEFSMVEIPSFQTIYNNNSPISYIKVVHVLVSSTSISSFSTHTIKLFTKVDLPASTYLQLFFPYQYSYLPTISTIYATISYTNTPTGNATFELQIELSSLLIKGSLINMQSGYVPVLGRRIEMKLSTLVNANRYIQILLSDVPTPSKPNNVDLNYLLVQAYSSSRTNLIARSYYLLNSCSIISFSTTPSTLVFNSATQIKIPKGTYSSVISLATPTVSNYLSNILLIFSSTGFNFIPSSNNVILYGQSKGQVRIGVDKTLASKSYSIQLSKSEMLLAPLYNMQSNLIVQVTSSQLVIPTVSSVQVPQGGCTIPQLITLPNPPFDQLQISLELNSTNSSEAQSYFSVDNVISSLVFQFTPKISSAYISFCFPSTQTSSILVKYLISGVNSPSYKVSNSSVTLNPVKLTKISSPTLSLSIESITLNSITLIVRTNTNGGYYYNLIAYYPGIYQQSPLSLFEIKQNLKNQNQNYQQQSDNLSTLYNYRRESSIGLVSAYSDTENIIKIGSLTSGVTYKLCSYLESQFLISTKQNCFSFTTIANGNIIKMSLTFTKTISDAETNSILCFFIQQGAIRLYNLVDEFGRTCSFGATPDNLLLSYDGTSSGPLNNMNVYIFPLNEITGQTGTSGLTSLFNPGYQSLLSSVISTAQLTYSINYINTCTLPLMLTYNQVLSGTLAIPTQTSIKSSATKNSSTSASIKIDSVTLSSDGFIYFLIETELTIISSTSDEIVIRIRESLPPTAQQILNCLNYYDEKTLFCGRVYYSSLSNTSGTLTFTGAALDSDYRIYYLVSNEYPLHPVVGNTLVQTIYVSTYDLSGNLSHQVQVLMMMILFIACF